MPRPNPHRLPAARPSTTDAQHQATMRARFPQHLEVMRELLRLAAVTVRRGAFGSVRGVATLARDLLAARLVSHADVHRHFYPEYRAFENTTGAPLALTGKKARMWRNLKTDPADLALDGPGYKFTVRAGAPTFYARDRASYERAAKAFERYAGWRAQHPRSPIDRFAEGFDAPAQHRAEALRWQIELDLAKAQAELSEALALERLGSVEFFIDKTLRALAAWCEHAGLTRVAVALKLIPTARAWELGDQVVAVLRAGLW